MRSWIAAGLACTVLLFSGHRAAAQTNSDPCQAPNGHHNPDETIARCTAQIQSGRLSADDLAGAYQKRGLAYEDKRDYDRAVADLDLAMKAAPRFASIFYRDRGVVYFVMGDYDRAIADFDQAIGLDPEYASAYGGRGAAYSEKHIYDRALADLDEAIRLDPKSVDTYETRGSTYVQMKDYDRAIADFDQIIRLDPQDTTGYLGRSIAYFSKGDFDRALADANQYVRLAPSEPNGVSLRAKITSNRGYAFLKQKRYREAVADYDAALKLMPNISVALYGRGLAKRATGDSAGGDADIAAAEKLDPGVGEAFKP